MMASPHAPGESLALAERLVRFGRSCGADEVEVGIGEGREFSVDVRLGRIENLVEAGSRFAGVRVIKDKRTAYASSSDLSPDALERLIRGAVKRAELSQPDPYSGLADLYPGKINTDALDIFDPEVEELPAKRKIDLALETERIALDDKRITNSHGAGFSTHSARNLDGRLQRLRGRLRQDLLRPGRGAPGGRHRRFGRGRLALQQDPFPRPGDARSRSPARPSSGPSASSTPARSGRSACRSYSSRSERPSLLGFLFGCISGTGGLPALDLSGRPPGPADRPATA